MGVSYLRVDVEKRVSKPARHLANLLEYLGENKSGVQTVELMVGDIDHGRPLPSIHCGPFVQKLGVERCVSVRMCDMCDRGKVPIIRKYIFNPISS